MTRGRGWSAAALLAIGAACTGLVGPEKEALAKARQMWEAAGVASYVYEYERLCFCPRQHGIVEVRDGTVVAVTDPETGEPVPEAEVGSYPTVEELFELLGRWLGAHPVRVDVAYDEVLGYPFFAFVDFRAEMIDEEQGFRAARLTAVRAGEGG